MLKRFKFLLIFSSFFIFLISISVKADTLGDKKTFRTNIGYDMFGRSSVAATLRTVSDHAYFYVDDKFWDSLNAIQQNELNNDIKGLANEFETVIYPKETQFWGFEPNPGIDKDPKITIFLEDLKQGNGGYFETINLVSKSIAADSNEREMIAANIETLGTTILKDFLAHELQHLISYNQKEILNKSTEDIWLNELRSEYSTTLVGYNNFYTGSNLDRRVRDFLDNPSDSLTEWPNVRTDYAVATIFGEYLADRFGSEILNQTLHYSSYSIPSLDQYLRTKNTTFADVFLDWMAAVYLNSRTADTRFGYSKGGLNTVKVSPQAYINFSSVNGDYNSGIAIKDWQPYWLEYNLQSVNDKTKSFKLDITGQSGQNFLVSYAAFYNNGQVVGSRIPLNNGRAIQAIPNYFDRQLTKVIVMVTNGFKTFDFEKIEPITSINIRATMGDVLPNELPVQSQTLKDGDLIKRPSESEIYVIWGKYKRYLNPDIIKLYGHLDPSKAIAVGPEIFDSYRSSNYVRYINDERVYAVWPDGTKHWLHITPAQWDASARDWNSIFIINELEVNTYKTGPDITR